MLVLGSLDLVLWERLGRNETIEEEKEWERRWRHINHKGSIYREGNKSDGVVNLDFNEKNEMKIREDNLVDENTYICPCKLSLFKVYLF